MQISPNKNVNFRCTSSSSTVESVGNGFVVYGQLTSGSLWASMTFLFTVFNLLRGSQLWRECVRVAISSNPVFTHHIRRLPHHGSSPPRSCPRLVLQLSGNIWHTASFSIPVFVQGTSTPQVHAHVGRTGQAERRSARFPYSTPVAAAGLPWSLNLTALWSGVGLELHAYGLLDVS